MDSRTHQTIDRKFNLPLFILAISLLLVVLPAIGSARVVEVAFYDGGFLYNSETGIGIDRDVIEELERRTDFSFEHTIKPRARIWRELETGILPLSVSGIATAERLQHSWFISYFSQRNRVLMTPASAVQFGSLDDFVNNESATIAVVRAFQHGAFYDQIIAQLDSRRIHEVSAVPNLFQMLKSERVDLIFSQPAMYRYQIQALEFDDAVVVDWDDVREPLPLGLIVSRSHFTEQEYMQLRDAIGSMRVDGTLRKIFSQYLVEEEIEDALNF